MPSIGYGGNYEKSTPYCRCTAGSWLICRKYSRSFGVISIIVCPAIAIAERNQTIAEKDQTIAEKDQMIAELRRRLGG
jgi:hypothetical protein